MLRSFAVTQMILRSAPLLLITCLLTGCSPSPEPKTNKATPTKKPTTKKSEGSTGSRTGVTKSQEGSTGSRTGVTKPQEAPPSQINPRNKPSPPKPQPKQHQPPQPPKIDAAALENVGIRRLTGKHLTLYTDLPSTPSVDTLPAIFDQAFPQWCEYFGLKPTDHDDWHITGFLIKDRALFKRLNLLPPELPPFLHGYAHGLQLWLYEQPSEYYRRHLLLHEGTHAFMNTLLGGCGPPWYMEGVAELLATHRLENATTNGGRLTLNYFPAARLEVPRWGRTKIIADETAAGRAKSFDEVLAYGPTAHLQKPPYAWSWAAAVLLDRHPRYRERFRKLYKNVLQPDFNDKFRKLIGTDWPDLVAQWQSFVAELDFGHDITRTTINLQPSAPLPPDGKTVRVKADQGWQNSGIQLQAGKSYRLKASGRYQVADKPRIWWCEPGGVTIRYYRGKPLGILLAVVYPKDTNNKNPFQKPITVGLGTTLTPPETGILLLKINDSPAELSDNAGHLKVHIEPIASEVGLTN